MWSSGGPGVVLATELFFLSLVLLIKPDAVVSARAPVSTLSSPPSWSTLLEPTSQDATLSTAVRCDMARIKCAHRQGCGLALQHYMVDCADLIAGKTDQCHLNCQRALIALVSSDEGDALMNCDCQGSAFCNMSKQRIDVCRPAVLEATAVDTIVPCATAQWICYADIQCSTALGYYHRNCRGMFKGSLCSLHCNNSLDILMRQERAAKLFTCYCDGTEQFPCQRIKANTERLCFGRGKQPEDNQDSEFNEIEVIARRQRVAMSMGSPRIVVGKGNLLLLIISLVVTLMVSTGMAGGSRGWQRGW